MELLACICVLKWIRENKPWKSVTLVQVFTDFLHQRTSV